MSTHTLHIGLAMLSQGNSKLVKVVAKPGRQRAQQPDADASTSSEHRLTSRGLRDLSVSAAVNQHQVSAEGTSTSILVEMGEPPAWSGTKPWNLGSPSAKCGWKPFHSTWGCLTMLILN